MCSTAYILPNAESELLFFMRDAPRFLICVRPVVRRSSNGEKKRGSLSIGEEQAAGDEAGAWSTRDPRREDTHEGDAAGGGTHRAGRAGA